MIGWCLSVALGGSLSGIVTDPNGSTVGGAIVRAVDPTGVFAETSTDAGGAYLLDLPQEVWRVRAIAPADQPWAEVWAPDATSKCASERFVVGEKSRVVADLVLRPGGALSGSVLLPTGEPAVGAALLAAPEDEAVARTTTVDASGDWRIDGLPAGPATVSIVLDGVPDQWVGGAPRASEASSFLAAAGTIVDVGTTTLLAGAEIGGVVVGPAGPVGEGAVTGYSPSQLAYTSIAPDGTFRIAGLPAGEALFWAIVPGLATTWFGDADRPDLRLPVAEGDVVTDLDVFLPTEAVLLGAIDGEGPFDGASVLVYNDDRTVGFAAEVFSDGSFRAGGLHGGTYTTWIDASGAGRVADLLRNADGSERAVTVPDEGVLDLGRIALPIAVSVEGRVIEQGTGRPLSNVWIVAQPSSIEGIRSTLSQLDGTYAIDGMTPGTWALTAYRLVGCPTDDGWVQLHHPDTPNALFSTPIELLAGEGATWDLQLPRDNDHDGMADAWERAFGLDPERDDGPEDLDEDGVTNLDEYLRGTDPGEVAEGCGCRAVRGAPGAWILVVLTAAIRRPLRRGDHTAGRRVL